MDPRQQLLQSLLSELDGFQLPERFDEAKKAQIMKGRKGQADIDAGRAAIRENEQLYQQAITQRRELQNKIGTLQTEIDAAKQQGSTIDKAAEREAEARSPGGIAQTIGANVAAPLVGYGTGRVMGMGLNALADRSQTSKNTRLQGVADDRVKGLTTMAGAREAALRSGAMPSDNSALRVGGRMLPHTITGLGMAAKGGAMLSQEDENDPLITQNINRAAGLGMIGTGVGVIEQGANYAINPGVAPDAQSIAVINSNQLRRNNLAETPEAPPPPAGPNPGTVPALRAEAKAAGIKGGYKMNKAQLNAALASIKQISNKVPVLAAPLAAGAIAASMTPDRAEAADGSGGGQDLGEVATNAAVAGTTAAGTGYGLNRLAQAAGPAARNALGIGGAMSMPLMAMDMGPNTPEELRAEQNDMARNYPWLSRVIGGGAREQLEMAQVPERNPLAAAGEPEPSYPLSGPLMKASRLELPHNVPADATKQANIASAFDPAMRGRPQNALSAAGQQKDPFGQALDEFMAFVQQEMAEQQQGAQQ